MDKWQLSRAGNADDSEVASAHGNVALRVALLLSEDPIGSDTAWALQQLGVDLAEILLAVCLLLAEQFANGPGNDQFCMFRPWLQYAVLMDDLQPSELPTSPAMTTGMDRIMQCMMLYAPRSLPWLQVCFQYIHLKHSNPSITIC